MTQPEILSQQRLVLKRVVGPSHHACVIGKCGMTRTVIAVFAMTLGVLFTVFMIAMAASYELNERCSEQMAWDGNC